MNEASSGPLDSVSADQPGFSGFDLAPAATAPYRVLARKYRPRSFDDLIGQDAMVRTIANSFEAGRIPQAWMLTGVRGVGKTTTARILARGLNYQRQGERREDGRPTIQMPDLGVQCEAIIEGRHIDVLEMDAASHTGVENMRQLTDAVRYAPTSARYKVYIIDEVHMLSTSAFNAFLKTLEEPPPHAKFVFATTELRKVPVTILSRCQRFDLRRIEADKLVAHLEKICGLEAVEAEPEALAMIARAAEGSVRDALSLLDQAIAHGAGRVSAAAVRDMLGLADRAQVIELFEAAMRGDLPACFAGLRQQYEAGADPSLILSDLANFAHLVTRLKLVPEAAKDASLTEIERARGAAFAEALPIGALSRAWQILLKAMPEVKEAPRPVAAAEMVLVRLCYAAGLPTPDEALRALKEGGLATSAGAPAPPERNPGPSGRLALAASQPRAAAAQRAEPAQTKEPAPRLRRFEDVVALAGEKREIALKSALERDVRLVRFEEGQIELALADGASRTLANDLARKLDEWTGRRWVVALSAADSGAPTLHQQRQARDDERRTDAAGHPLVQAVLARFPGAEIVDVRQRGGECAGAAAELLGPDNAMGARETEADDDL